MRRLGILLLLGLPLKAQEISFSLPPPRAVAPTASKSILLEWQRQTVAACLVLEAACQGLAAGMAAHGVTDDVTVNRYQLLVSLSE